MQSKIITEIPPEPLSECAPQPNLLTGRLCGHPKGFAFVHIGDGLPDIFIPPGSRMGAQHGEVVKVALDQDDHDKRTGHVVSLPENLPEWVGEVVGEDGQLLVRPIDPRHFVTDLLPGNAHIGDIIRIRLEQRPTSLIRGQAKCIAVLGNEPTSDVINDLVFVTHHLPADYTEEDVAGLEKLNIDFTDPTRRDMRSTPFVTIDALHSKDLDDALWADENPDGTLRLCVAIADVSYFVKPGSKIDEMARKRTTSIYLPGKVLPMLPKVLSQDLCSLNPGVDRLAVVCDMTVSIMGEVLSSSFYRATINSHARLTYDNVERHIFDDVPFPDTWSAVTPSLKNLRRVYETLLVARQLRGAMDFDRPDASVNVSQGGAIFKRSSRGHSHRLVEETMIAANVQAAKTLDERSQESLYRAHGAPPVKKMEALQTLLSARSITLENQSPAALARLAKEYPGLCSAILRAQDKATYRLRNAGHFGLALAHYAHFTSPIRRYPDLVIHRILLGEDQPDLEELAHLCSEGERRATLAEREAVDRLRAVSLCQQVGTRFTGKIESITRMGIFVTLDVSRASGLVPYSAMENSLPDIVSQTLLAPDGNIWEIGDAIEVALSSSDWRTNKIEFAAPKRVVE